MKLIVVYGADNLGKTTQVNLLRQHMEADGMTVLQIKYPVYDLAPTGILISQITRQLSNL